MRMKGKSERREPRSELSRGMEHFPCFIAGERCPVIVALDDPDLIITIHFRRRR
jgi:hypothetical protein